MTAKGRRWMAGLLAAAAWGVSRASRVEVVGDSMRPTLHHGDRLVLLRSGRLRLGDLVAVVDPREARRTVVKRLVDMGPDGLTVLGDNPAASTDSRMFGSVAADTVRGRVVYRYHPASRRGRPGSPAPGAAQAAVAPALPGRDPL